MMLKLISVGHPKSKPYYEEICGALFPNETLSECEMNLYFSMERFSEPTNILEDMVSTIQFASNEISQNTSLGQGFQMAICNNFWERSSNKLCTETFKNSNHKMNDIFQTVSFSDRRKKRSACVVRSPGRTSGSTTVVEAPSNTV
jgi:hypothetical protein